MYKILVILKDNTKLLYDKYIMLIGMPIIEIPNIHIIIVNNIFVSKLLIKLFM